MKLATFSIMFLTFCFQTITIGANDLQGLETERELHRLAKIKLHGEPLKFEDNLNASKVIAFSPDGKYLAVAFTPGPTVIYDLLAEKTKRLDLEKEKMKQEVNNKNSNNFLENSEKI